MRQDVPGRIPAGVGPVGVWAALLISLALLLALRALGPSPLVAGLIAALAIGNATLMFWRWMHLRAEPALIKWFVILAAGIVLAFAIGVAPDVLGSFGR